MLSMDEGQHLQSMVLLAANLVRTARRGMTPAERKEADALIEGSNAILGRVLGELNPRHDYSELDI